MLESTSVNPHVCCHNHLDTHDLKVPGGKSSPATVGCLYVKLKIYRHFSINDSASAKSAL